MKILGTDAPLPRIFMACFLAASQVMAVPSVVTEPAVAGVQIAASRGAA
jgi:hypothetical protein